MKTKESEKKEARRDLTKLVRRGTTVYTVLRHVSASGMSRRIDLYVIKKNEPLRITWGVARLLGCRMARDNEGLVVGGCGMDMGFHLVHSLSYALHGHEPYTEDTPRHDRSGYTLDHRWI